jgi:hypothetical protein
LLLCFGSFGWFCVSSFFVNDKKLFCYKLVEIACLARFVRLVRANCKGNALGCVRTRVWIGR